MVARIQYEVDFKVVDNIQDVINHFRTAVAQLGTGTGAGGQFASITQQAASRVREITSQQGLPLSELARGLGGLRDIVRDINRTAGPGFRRSTQAAGLYPSELLKLPEGYNLQTVRQIQQTADQARRSAVAGAGVQTALAGDTDYIEATAQAARARQQIAASTQSALAGDGKYATITAQLATARQRIAADTQQALATDPAYRIAYQQATQRLTVARQQQQAGLQSALAGDGEYLGATRRLAVARQIQQAKLQEGLAGDTQYQAATQRLAIARQQQQATLQSSLANEPQYVAATAALARARQQQQAGVQAALASDPAYQEATLALALSRRRQEASTQQGLAADPLYATATATAARAREQIKAQTAEMQVADEQFRSATKRAAVARAQLQAELQTSLAADPQYREATVRAAAAKEQQAANLRSGLASDQQYINATARLALAREEQAARTQLARVGETYTGTSRQELLSRAALAKRTEADLLAANTARTALAGEQAGIRATAERRIEENKLAAAIRIQERQLLKAALKEPGALGGTFYQRLQARASPTARLPTEFPTIGQAAVQKTLTTGGYAVGGLVAGSILYGTIQAVKEASELQEQLAGLQGQMEALGRGDQFVVMREEIKSVANETGKATQEIAQYYSRVLGLTDSPSEALHETADAMKLMTVAGIDMGTMIEEVVPITKAFGIGVGELGDIAVGIRDQFGVAEESTLKFLGETSATMREAGFSAQEAAVVGATAANVIGKTSGVVGEQFSKVLGTIEQNQSKIVDVYRRSPETLKYADPVIEAFTKGDTAAAFKAMLASYGKLDKIQQQSLIRVSGSRREWAFLSGLYSNAPKLLNDLSNAELLAGKNGEVLDERFQKVSDTLNRTLERVKELFTNLVEGIVSSGIGSVLNGVGVALEQILIFTNAVIAAFNKLNDATKFGPFDDGLLQFLTQIALGVFLATKAWGVYTSVRATGARVTSVLTAAEERLAASQVGAAGAASTETAALGANTVAKEGNAVATNALAGQRFTQTGSGLIVPAGTAPPAAAGGIRGLFGKAVGGIGGAYAAAKGVQVLGAGASLGSNVLGGAGVVASGYLSSNWARDQFREGGWLARLGGVPEGGLVKQSEQLRDRLKDLSTERINQLAEDHRNAWERVTDNIQSAIFDVDIPQTQFFQERQRRIGAEGARDIGHLRQQGFLSQFTEKIKDQNLEQLESWLKNAGDAGSEFADKYGFRDAQNNIDIARDQLAAKLPELEQQAKNGDEGAARFVAFIHDVINVQGGMEEVRQQIAEAVQGVSQEDLTSQIEAAGGIDQWLNMTYDPRGAYEAGTLTRKQYLAQLESNLALAKRTVTGKKEQEEAYAEINRKTRELQDFRIQVIKDDIGRLALFNEGSPTAKAEDLRNLLDRLPELDLPAQIKVLPDIYSKAQDAYQEELDKIQSPFELYARTVEGWTVPAEARSIDMQRLVQDNEAATAFFTRLGWSYGQDATEMAKRFSDLAAERGLSLQDAVIQELTAQRDILAAVGAPTRIYDELIALAASSLGGIDTPTKVAGDERAAQKALIQSKQRARQADITLQRSRGSQGRRAQAAADIALAQSRLDTALELRAAGVGGPDIDAEIKEAQAGVNDALRASADIANDITEAMLNWAVVEAHGDPVAETTAQLRIATFQAQRILRTTGDVSDPDYIRALQSIRELQLRQADNMREIAKAGFELASFERNRDPIQAARDQIWAALFELQGARGEAARSQALLSVKQAERALEEAEEEIIQANVELAITLANVRQDPVAAARLAVQEAERRLAVARAQGLGAAEIQQLVGDLEQKRSDAIDAAVAEQEDIINFMLEMGQITQAQAIQRLKVERDKYAVGTKKWRDLQLKIHQLEQGAKADTQFNLPSNITIPTLYEARRLNQSRAMGIGYMDNRSVDLTFNVNGAQDPELVSTMIVNAMQSALGVGQIYTPGVTVGLN